MKTGMILDIDHFAVHDGPGIRTCVYFKGCPLSCKWCHSPESQSFTAQLMFAEERCTGCGACMNVCPAGCQSLTAASGYKRKSRFKDCTLCGLCFLVCPSGALFQAGKAMDVQSLSHELLQDKVFYDNSGGGVTLSGGEVLSQAAFAFELLCSLHAEGIHTIVETSGYGKKEELLRLAEKTSLFYYDYKLSDPDLFREYTGKEADVVFENLRELRTVTDQIVLRVPMIPGVTDTDDNIAKAYCLIQSLCLKEIHFLPYNELAGAKYEWCGRSFSMEKRKADRNRLVELARKAPAGVTVRIME